MNVNESPADGSTSTLAVVLGLQKEIVSLQEHIDDLHFTMIGRSLVAGGLPADKSFSDEIQNSLTLMQKFGKLDSFHSRVQMLEELKEKNETIQTLQDRVQTMKDRMQSLEEENTELQALSADIQRSKDEGGVAAAVGDEKMFPPRDSKQVTNNSIEKSEKSKKDDNDDDLRLNEPEFRVLFSGFKQRHAVYNIELRSKLYRIVEGLNGEIVDFPLDSDLPNVPIPKFTHLVSPPMIRTIKTIAACLIPNVWRVPPEWLLECERTKRRTAEKTWGVKTIESPLFGKKIELSKSFLAECELNPAKMQNVRTIVEVLGKGSLLAGEDNKGDADITLIGQRPDVALRNPILSPKSTCTWNKFLDYLQTATSAAAASGNNFANTPSERRQQNRAEKEDEDEDNKRHKRSFNEVEEGDNNNNSDDVSTGDRGARKRHRIG